MTGAGFAGWFRRCAAILAALCLLAAGAQAQDVTLSARDGSLALDGTLLSWDGEFYRLDTAYGPLTVDGTAVICEGPGCPDLSAPLAVIRITGVEAQGLRLLPGLFAAFAKARGLVLAETPVDGVLWAADLSDPKTGNPLAKLQFSAAPPETARASLTSGTADLALALKADPGFSQRVVALEALVPVVARDNPLPRISTADLARALSGEVTNWGQIGGPDMPIVLHALSADTALQEVLATRLGRPVAAQIVHRRAEDLAAAVARDPWALAVTLQSAAGDARALPLTDSCGFVLAPTRLALKAEDYPLTVPVHLISPQRRLPLMARDFLDFLALPPAEAAGLTSRAPVAQPLTADGPRLIQAIGHGREELSLPDLRALAATMAEAERLSLTFRFQDGGAVLDASAQDNLTRLAQMIGADMLAGKTLLLAGFAGMGDPDQSHALSQAAAQTIAKALGDAADIPPPQVQGFGAILPMACDNTPAGRRLNNRVEVWLRPAVTDSHAP